MPTNRQPDSPQRPEQLATRDHPPGGRSRPILWQRQIDAIDRGLRSLDTWVTWSVLLAYLALLVLICGQSRRQADPPDTAALGPRMLGITHLYMQVTAWDDGTVDVSPPVPLDSRTARRLARRLEDEEDRNRALRRALDQQRRDAAISPPAAHERQTTSYNYADPGQCIAIATSTGKRCRNKALRGKQYCNVHQHLHPD